VHLRPTAADIRPQVEDQGGAYQTEARRHGRNQHSGCKARKDNEGTAPRHATRTLGDLRGVRACQYLAFEDVIRDVDADEEPCVKHDRGRCETRTRNPCGRKRLEANTEQEPFSSRPPGLRGRPSFR
jgi:hypothetical protein